MTNKGDKNYIWQDFGQLVVSVGVGWEIGRVGDTGASHQSESPPAVPAFKSTHCYKLTYYLLLREAPAQEKHCSNGLCP